MVNHLLRAILAASIAAFCGWNVYRGFSGLSMFLYIRRKSGWHATEGLDAAVYWFYMGFWTVVGLIAAYFAWHQLRVWLKG